MKKWVCSVCGYVWEGDAPPEKCPVCKVPGSKFVEHYWVKQYWNGTIKISSITMHGVWQWTVCSAVSRSPIQQSVSIVCAVF